MVGAVFVVVVVVVVVVVGFEAVVTENADPFSQATDTLLPLMEEEVVLCPVSPDQTAGAGTFPASISSPAFATEETAATN